VPVGTGSSFSRDAKRSASVTITRDEGIRPDSTAEALAKLKPAFRSDGTVTAGNASMLSDGAAALVVASARALEKIGAKPLARIGIPMSRRRQRRGDGGGADVRWLAG